MKIQNKPMYLDFTILIPGRMGSWLLFCAACLSISCSNDVDDQPVPESLEEANRGHKAAA